MLDNNVPVFLVTFATQELLLYRNAKTGEAVVGSEDAVDSCRYAIVLTRVDTELENPLTGGWKVVEVSPCIFGLVWWLTVRWLDEEPRASCSFTIISMMQHHSHPLYRSRNIPRYCIAYHQNCVKSGCTKSFCLKSTIFDDVVENYRSALSHILATRWTYPIPDKHSRSSRNLHINSHTKLSIIPIRIQIPLPHPDFIPSFGR
jgi:hypothetical protein